MNSRISRLLVAAGLAVALIACATVAGAAATSNAPRARAFCPHATEPLPANALAGATDAALQAAPRLYSAIDTRGVMAERAARAGAAAVRGAQVRRECGSRIAARSVVIDLAFPRMRPSASLSQGTVFVGLEHGAFRVWRVAH